MNNMKISNGENRENTPTACSFNLVDEPWIPVVDLRGKTSKVGLRELFERAEDLADLATNALETIALYRLFICITQRALDGPKDDEEWKTARGRLVKACVDYLERWKDRFDLFGERPFLQISDIEANGGLVKTDKLDFALATGASSSLFDQNAFEDGRSHLFDWLAIKLITFQSFSPGGRIGVAKIRGRETEGNGSSSSAPCVEGCALLTLLKGERLAETLCWNLLSNASVGGNWGRPVWEYDSPSDVSTQREIVDSYLGRLAPLPRFVKLEDNGREMVLANGATYSKLPEYRESMGTVRVLIEKIRKR